MSDAEAPAAARSGRRPIFPDDWSLIHKVAIPLGLGILTAAVLSSVGLMWSMSVSNRAMTHQVEEIAQHNKETAQIIDGLVVQVAVNQTSVAGVLVDLNDHEDAPYIHGSLGVVVATLRTDLAKLETEMRAMNDRITRLQQGGQVH